MLRYSQKVKEPKGQPLLGDYFTRGIRFHKLAEAIEEAHPDTLLVIGCGNGYLESILSDSMSIVSGDLDGESLEVARALNRDKPNRDFRLMDIYDIGPHNTPALFDGVVISEVLEHLEDDVKALETARDVLAPDGRLFLTIPNEMRFQNRPRTLLSRRPRYMSSDHVREYTLESGLDMVDRAGFACTRVSGLDFWFPKDSLVQPVVSFGSPIRRKIANRFPRLATWYLMVCQKK